MSKSQFMQKLQTICHPIRKIKELKRKAQKKADRIERRVADLSRKVDNLFIQNQMLFWWSQAKEGQSIEDIQKEFYQRIPKADPRLRLVQEGNAYLLARLQEICDRHGIDIWLDFGSLLGAVRHKGFIPWDDDLAVAIMRKDLERLRAVMDQYPEFQIQDSYYNYRTVGRFTRFIAKDFAIPCFVDLDVFDYCNLPDDDDTWALICSLREKFTAEMAGVKRSLHEDYNVPNAVVMPHNYEDIRKMREVCDRYAGILGDEQEYQSVYWAIDSIQPVYRALIDRSILFPLRELEFERGRYKVPGDWDAYLRKQYDNYYMLPPNVGVSKHSRFTSYASYLDDIEGYLREHAHFGEGQTDNG